MIAPRIMVVEDEEPLGVLLRYNLESEGYQVEVVSRGDEAEIRLSEACRRDRETAHECERKARLADHLRRQRVPRARHAMAAVLREQRFERGGARGHGQRFLLSDR